MSEPSLASRLVLIPGMGADHRLFDGIGLPGREVLRTDWIPHRDGEHLSAYAGRFADHYGVGAADILIGVSMGGIVARAMAQRMPPQRLILISSCTVTASSGHKPAPIHRAVVEVVEVAVKPESRPLSQPSPQDGQRDGHVGRVGPR